MRLLGACLAALVANLATAGPMGYNGSTMAMGDFGRDWAEAWVNHAVTPRDALGAGYTWMRSDDGKVIRRVAEATYTRLVHRWNLPHAQANAWFVVGAGAMSGTGLDGERFAWTPGAQLDYETTRVYVAAMGRLYRSGGVANDYAAVRAGFSFYEAEYEETQPWFVVEARRMRGLSDGVEVTPMLRFISSRYFVEVGANLDGRPRVNFMYVF
jgi:hypothetical protein